MIAIVLKYQAQVFFECLMADTKLCPQYCGHTFKWSPAEKLIM